MTMLTAPEMRDFIKTHFTATAFRWECLPAYEVASDGTDFGRYLAGEPGPTPERKQPWLDRLADEYARGLRRSRVRLLHNPLTDYERYECEWGYVPNVGAGEQVSVLRLGEHELPNPDALAANDWWLLDDRHLLVMHYGPAGEFHGAEHVTDELSVAVHRAARQLLSETAEPFTTWWARHPELYRDTRKAA